MTTLLELDTLTVKDYQDAIEIWENGACNSRALINWLQRAQEKMPFGQVNKHPITKLVLAQLAYLAGIGVGDCDDADKEAWEYILEHTAR